MPMTTLRPSLVGRVNERHILRMLQKRGPLSRAEVSRISGLSAPTVSKAIVTLVSSGLLEETDMTENARGRPAHKIRLATETAQVIGVVIDREHCTIVSTGLDGRVIQEAFSFDTPKTYEETIETIAVKSKELIDQDDVITLGLAISVPGLVDVRTNTTMFASNLMFLNGHRPSVDLQAKTKIPCWLIQEAQGLCLAEKQYGQARDLENFVLLDANIGLGVSALLDGKLVVGQNGYAGELGHISTISSNGRQCGCGNFGCLETVASDSALAWRISESLGRSVTFDESIQLVKENPKTYSRELSETAEALGTAVAASVNLFNPIAVFIYTRLFDADSGLLDQVVKVAKKQALSPSIEKCRIERSVGSKQQGAIAAAVLNVIDAVAEGI